MLKAHNEPCLVREDESHARALLQLAGLHFISCQILQQLCCIGKQRLYLLHEAPPALPVLQLAQCVPGGTQPLVHLTFGLARYFNTLLLCTGSATGTR